MNTYKLNNVEVSQEEIKKLIKDNPDILEEKSFEEKMLWKKYFWIDVDGDKNYSIWENAETDNKMLLANNVFFSEQECDKEIARRFALGRIMKFIRDNKIELVKGEDWEKDMAKFSIIGWDYMNDEIKWDFYSYLNHSQYGLAFYSIEDMNKVINNCKKDLEILLKR